MPGTVSLMTLPAHQIWAGSLVLAGVPLPEHTAPVDHLGDGVGEVAQLLGGQLQGLPVGAGLLQSPHCHQLHPFAARDQLHQSAASRTCLFVEGAGPPGTR